MAWIPSIAGIRTSISTTSGRSRIRPITSAPSAGCGGSRCSCRYGRHDRAPVRGGEMTVRVVLVDDEELVRTGLRAIIEAEADLMGAAGPR